MIPIHTYLAVAQLFIQKKKKAVAQLKIRPKDKKKRLTTYFDPLTYFWFLFWSPNYKVSQFSLISLPPFTNVVLSVSFLMSKFFDVILTI